MEDLFLKKWVVALGEVGLDRICHESLWQLQEEVLRKVLMMTKPLQPLIVHVRGHTEATAMLYARALKILKEGVAPTRSIHLHCFGGSAEQVAAWLDVFPSTYFGFTAAVSKLLKFLRAGLWFVPKDRLLIETDTPYFYPEGTSGSTPTHIGPTALLVSQVRHESLQEVLATAMDEGCTDCRRDS